MNERQLETFVAVGRERSFSAAARRLFVSQPAVSYQVKDLESELGVTLFTRSRSHVEPTEAGARLAGLAPEALASFARIREEMAAFRSEPACVVGCTSFMLSVDADFFTALFARIQREHSEARVQMRLLSADDGMELVDKGRLDAAVQGFRLGEEPPARFGSLLFATVRSYVMVSSHGALAYKGRLVVDDIRGRTVYTCLDDLSNVPVILRDVQRACGLELRVQEVESYALIPSLVGGGSGVSLTTVPRPNPSVTYVPLDVPVGYDIRLVWRRERESEAIRAVADAFAQAFATHMPGMSDF